jgi:hypothetical protein
LFFDNRKIKNNPKRCQATALQSADARQPQRIAGPPRSPRGRQT